MARPRRPQVASLDQVRIERRPDGAFIEYADDNLMSVHFRLGPVVAEMTDQEILDALNADIEAREEMAAAYEHVAVEVPIGSPQIRYFDKGYQWTPRGDVLRCVISDGGPDFETTVCIDDKELSLADFGRMLLTYNGWGMRITFVPEDRTHEQPVVEVREPEEPEEPGD